MFLKYRTWKRRSIGMNINVPMCWAISVKDRKKCDSAILKYFNRGVEQGIFRPDINFDIINQAMVMQMDLLIYSDMLESYPLVEIYSEITLLHMRGITTRKGSEMVDAFLCQMKEKQVV